jgi:hypothetical protein
MNLPPHTQQYVWVHFKNLFAPYFLEVNSDNRNRDVGKFSIVFPLNFMLFV